MSDEFNKKHAIINPIILLVSICFGVLTFVLSSAYNVTPSVNIVSACISIAWCYYFMYRFEWIATYNRSTTVIRVLSAVVAYFSADIIRRRFYDDGPRTIKNIFLCTDKASSYYYLIFVAISIIALYVCYTYIFEYIYKNVINKILLSMTSKEKVYFFGFVGIMTILAVNAHLSNSAFDYGKYINSAGEIVANDFDSIMDCDSLAVQWHMRHFDFLFRHPLFPIAALPDYSVARALGIFFPKADQGVMLILSLFNILRLAVCGICISRLAKTDKVLPFFYTSFPVILYSLVIERHTWMTFWNVVMVFITFEYIEKSDDECEIDYLPVYQAGASNLTGVVIAIPVLIRTRKSIRDFIKKGVELAVSFFALIVISGNLGGLLTLPSQLSANADFVGTIGFCERLTKYTHAVKSCFAGIKISYHSYYVTSYDETGISVIGIIISAIMIIANIKLWKKSYARVCAFWMLFSFILFPLVGFSSEDFSMHMVLFSWAAISLIVMLGEQLYMDARNKWIKYGIATVGFAFLLWQFTTNFATLTELLSYASRFNYTS